MRNNSPSPRLHTCLVLLPLLTLACSSMESPRAPGPVPSPAATGPQITADRTKTPTGLLVMAHGGGGEWDHAVGQAVAPLRQERPTALALGMADPVTLQAALDSLRLQGVERVAVVRLFVSGTSFLAQTRYLLGLGPAPAHFISHHGGEGHQGPPDPVVHGLDVATHVEGLVDHEATGRILLERSRQLSTDPGSESVLWLAHGLGDPDANGRLEAAMARGVRALKEAGFAEARAMALREDWPEARQRAETEIRGWVSEQVGLGRRVLVVPLRVSGFGPYAEILADLPYRRGEGLLPHEAITDWIRERLSGVEMAEGWVEARSAQGR